MSFEESHAPDDRVAARNPRRADPEGDLARPSARIRRSAPDPAGFPRQVEDSTGLPVSRPVPAGAPGPDYVGMGGVREQAAGEVLPPDHGWEAPAAGWTFVLAAPAPGGLDRAV